MIGVNLFKPIFVLLLLWKPVWNFEILKRDWKRQTVLIFFIEVFEFDCSVIEKARWTSIMLFKGWNPHRVTFRICVDQYSTSV